MLTEEAKESGCFAWRWLAASAGRVLRYLMEPQLACLGFSPGRSATLRTVMDYCAPATHAGAFPTTCTTPPGPGLADKKDVKYDLRWPGTQQPPAQGSLA